jgi:hypothetical protein
VNGYSVHAEFSEYGLHIPSSDFGLLGVQIPNVHTAGVHQYLLSSFGIRYFEKSHIRKIQLDRVDHVHGNGIVTPGDRAETVFKSIIHEITEHHYDGTSMQHVNHVIERNLDVGAR